MKRFFERALASLAALALFLAGPAWAVNNPVTMEAGTTAGHVTVVADCVANSVAVAAIVTTGSNTADTPTDSGSNTWHLLYTTAASGAGKIWTYYSVLTSSLTVAGASWVQGTQNNGTPGQAAHNSFVCVTDARADGSVTPSGNTGSSSSPTTGAPNGPIVNTAQPEWIMVAELTSNNNGTATLTGLNAVSGSSTGTNFGLKWHYVRTLTNASNTYTTASTYTSWNTSWSSYVETGGGGGGTTTAACPNQLLLGEC